MHRTESREVVVFDRFQRYVERLENDIVTVISCHVDGSFSLKTQTFEKDATTTTNYSNYLDTQTIDFSGFLPFSPTDS